VRFRYALTFHRHNLAEAAGRVVLPCDHVCPSIVSFRPKPHHRCPGSGKLLNQSQSYRTHIGLVVISAPVQLKLANSETIIVGAPSLGSSELQGFEQHALEHLECVGCASRVICERRQAKGCQERDQRVRIPRGKGNAELATEQRE
jgi:hypothetical protein